eukprot:jgi/Mesvir1/5379/Mv15458-RA.1
MAQAGAAPPLPLLADARGVAADAQGQLGHFMPFCLAMLALLSRMFILTQHLLVLSAASYNRLWEQRPASVAQADIAPLPSLLQCVWRGPLVHLHPMHDGVGLGRAGAEDGPARVTVATTGSAQPAMPTQQLEAVAPLLPAPGQQARDGSTDRPVTSRQVAAGASSGKTVETRELRGNAWGVLRVGVGIAAMEDVGERVPYADAGDTTHDTHDRDGEPGGGHLIFAEDGSRGTHGERMAMAQAGGTAEDAFGAEDAMREDHAKGEPRCTLAPSVKVSRDLEPSPSQGCGHPPSQVAPGMSATMGDTLLICEDSSTRATPCWAGAVLTEPIAGAKELSYDDALVLAARGDAPSVAFSPSAAADEGRGPLAGRPGEDRREQMLRDFFGAPTGEKRRAKKKRGCKETSAGTWLVAGGAQGLRARGQRMGDGDAAHGDDATLGGVRASSLPGLRHEEVGREPAQGAPIGGASVPSQGGVDENARSRKEQKKQEKREKRRKQLESMLPWLEDKKGVTGAVRYSPGRGPVGESIITGLPGKPPLEARASAGDVSGQQEPGDDFLYTLLEGTLLGGGPDYRR